jgi:2-haloacid dehalogenase
MIAPLSSGNIRLVMDKAKQGALPWDTILGALSYKSLPAATDSSSSNLHT